MNQEKHIFISIAPEELRTLMEEAVKDAIANLPKDEPSPKEDDQLMTINDVCKFFGKSRQTIYEWMKKGILPFRKISNRTYFLKKDLLEALKKVHLK